ncbi:MAG: GH25 family lysozyme [Bacteroidota bacterium]
MILLVLAAFFSALGYFTFQHYKKNKVQKSKHELLTTIPEGFSSFGIDVSHYQGKINWERVLKDNDMDSVISFVYCKASEGEDIIDEEFAGNRAQLNQLQKANGAYHYFTSANPLQQAKNFLNVWKKESLDLPPVLDVEVEISHKKTLPERNKELVAAMKIWLNYVEKESGMRPIIYTNLYMYNSKFENVFENYHFWVALYNRHDEQLNDERVLYWQYSDQGEVPGFPKNIDVNVSKVRFD